MYVSYLRTTLLTSTSSSQARLRMFPCPGSTTTISCRVFPDHLIISIPAFGSLHDTQRQVFCNYLHAAFATSVCPIRGDGTDSAGSSCYRRCPPHRPPLLLSLPHPQCLAPQAARTSSPLQGGLIRLVRYSWPTASALSAPAWPMAIAS